MQVIYRAARVFADEGFGGLFRRVGRKVAGRRATPAESPEAVLARTVATADASYQRQAEAFRARTRELGHTGLEHYYWYHTIDLGNGLVTPGDYDFRDQLPAFDFPANMSGMRALDVGSATGFFAFEFERRGAATTSVELPSLAAWDMIYSEREAIVADVVRHHHASSVEQAYERHLDGPFRFCHAALKSRVRRCYCPVYDVSLEKVGEPFDLVYAGDLLLHLFSPFAALNALASVCRGTLMLTIDLPFPGADEQPVIALSNKEEGRSWCAISRGWAECALRRLGFATVETVGRYEGIARCTQRQYIREVIRATR